MASSFAHLLSPGRIGSMTLRNRIVMTAMGSDLAEGGGIGGARLRAYYAERAKGGVGLIMTEAVSVGYPFGAGRPNVLALSEDRHIDGMRVIVEGVHEHGGKIAVQLNHTGPNARQDIKAVRPLWTSSKPRLKPSDVGEAMLESEIALGSGTIAMTGGAGAPPLTYNPLSHEDIGKAVNMWASAAARAQAAGADGVEVHAAHGYLISSFISPNTNQRTDEYGGSVENRARMLVEVLKGIRSAVGRDFPVWCKIDSQEFFQDHGITVEDAKITARLAQEAGANAITASAYHNPAFGLGQSNSHTPHIPGLLIANAAIIKSAIDIPVITPGRIEPEVADRGIADGRFDFVSMGRKLLAEPHLPNKLAAGKRDDIRPCIYCYTCISQLTFGGSIRCAVRPETGNEIDVPAVAAAPRKKRVVVVGAGPGGMETARRLALKGHAVTLVERGRRMGGTLRLASIAYEPNERLLRWLHRQLEQSPVEVKLGTEATIDSVRAFGADAIVVATGAVRAAPAIPGVDSPCVLTGDDLRNLLADPSAPGLAGRIGAGARLASKLGAVAGLTAMPGFIRESSKAWMPLGKRIVIIGGDLVGLELAEFLRHRGRTVTVIDDIPRFGAGMPIVRRYRMLHELKEMGVPLLRGVQDIGIGERSVNYLTDTGQRRSIGTDHVIVAKGARGDLTLATALRGAGLDVFTVGDCEGVGYIDGAMKGAAVAAEAI